MAKTFPLCVLSVSSERSERARGKESKAFISRRDAEFTEKDELYLCPKLWESSILSTLHAPPRQKYNAIPPRKRLECQQNGVLSHSNDKETPPSVPSVARRSVATGREMKDYRFFCYVLCSLHYSRITNHQSRFTISQSLTLNEKP